MNWPPARKSSGITLSHTQRIDWLRLTRTESVGPLTFNTLINRFGGASAALEALPDLLRKQGKGQIRVCTVDTAERELEIAADAGVRFIARGEGEYPAMLRQIASAPPLIALKGTTAVFDHPMVAIVGSRNASAAGRSFTDKLAKGLTQHGFAISSGLARGIDTRAHEAALAFGTVAVLAGGLDRPYPPENVGLLERICETGAVITEMPMGWEARGRDFPRRNRIISGLASATVLVEAARKSGSLITARFALEQNREVFAVPGSPLDPRAEGTNALLKDRKAHICTSVDDIVTELQPMLAEPDLFGGPLDSREATTPTYGNEPLWEELLVGEEAAQIPFAHLAYEAAPPYEPHPPGTADERVTALLGPAPVEVDEVVRLSGASLREVQQVLLGLELAGRLERHGGNRVSLLG